ncbi:DNA-(apurinic or apyrimidinic site) lyase /endonuclease III [Desulfomicrobium apsheronum]|uniref:Endonuclease III n=1 Tax=Desulfomicrobium apsheronum TaxID=52560 RepID=A0A1I3QEC5_9BACT|nr:endonuclease III [Desulfomicrobium apsheronum]SFJ31711.1 DNA-(apurinic or apyrimidinic site) lyase /endonuclease III [Desulfomicrobium apsheronum]
MRVSSITARARAVRERLAQRYPAPRTELSWSTPWELLVATILSAQCTDARVNMVTPGLFATWKTVEQMAKADPAQIEGIIRSTGFFRNKAKNLHASAMRIVTEFGGQVPRTMEEMLTLAGVARKTANVVLSNAFGVHAGIAVDTHVKRISFRLGLTRQTNPDKVEQDLLKLFPQDSWGAVNHYLVLFGREVCTAHKPNCEACELDDICPRTGVTSSSASPTTKHKA